jgi:hypothetical protein
MAKVVLMMETTLGMEHHGDDRCHACIERNIPCVRFIKGANRQILDCGSSCAWCRFVDIKKRKGCSKSDSSQARTGEGDGDEGDESDSSTSGLLEAAARSPVNDEIGTSATPADTHFEIQQAATQDTSETVSQASLSTSKRRPDDRVTLPILPPSDRNSSDHPMLRLEDLIGDLDEDDAQDAQIFIDLIKRNLEKGRDTKGPASLLTRLFAPVKQRIAEEYESLLEAKRRLAEEYVRVTKDMAQVAQKKKVFDNATEDSDVIKIED